MKKYSILFVSLFFSLNCFAQNLPFNKKLSEEDKSKLLQGQTLIRTLDYASQMCIENSNKGCDTLLSDVKKLRPSYIAEIIQVRPYKENENLPSLLQNYLSNVQDYVGIQYYSTRHKKNFDLYSSAKIKSDITQGNIRTVNTELKMDPFGNIDTTINITSTPEYTYYHSTNENELWYFDKFKCINPRKMMSSILLFRDGDFWILYGIGGVHAAKIPFFEARIETSFINRIKTFCNFIFEKLDQGE